MHRISKRQEPPALISWRLPFRLQSFHVVINEGVAIVDDILIETDVHDYLRDGGCPFGH